jgi:RNA polymerase sigma-70 factor (ECF subfamily)
VDQQTLYAEMEAEYGPALSRLARAYEADADKRRDLLQEIHLQIWRSLERFEEQCSMRTWIYRVAHNVGASHVIRERRTYASLVTLDELEGMASPPAADRAAALDKLGVLIRRLKPLDRQVIVMYLEDFDAKSIGEVVGLSPANVAMKIHRIKNLLARRYWTNGR